MLSTVDSTVEMIYWFIRWDDGRDGVYYWQYFEWLDYNDAQPNLTACSVTDQDIITSVIATNSDTSDNNTDVSELKMLPAVVIRPVLTAETGEHLQQARLWFETAHIERLYHTTAKHVHCTVMDRSRQNVILPQCLTKGTD